MYACAAHGGDRSRLPRAPVTASRRLRADSCPAKMERWQSTTAGSASSASSGLTATTSTTTVATVSSSPAAAMKSRSPTATSRVRSVGSARLTAMASSPLLIRIEDSASQDARSPCQGMAAAAETGPGDRAGDGMKCLGCGAVCKPYHRTAKHRPVPARLRVHAGDLVPGHRECQQKGVCRRQ
jgi:hypothetical protein